MVKRLFKAVILFISGVLLLTGLTCLILSTGFLNDFILAKSLEQTQNLLHGQIKVGRAEGNPLTHLKLHDITLENQADTIIKINQLELNFDWWRLMHNELSIPKIDIDQISLEIKQGEDGRWNFARLYHPAEESANRKESPSNFIVNMGDISCKNLKANIIPTDSSSLIPRSITSGMQLNFRMKGDQMHFQMKKLDIDFVHPDLSVRDLRFHFSVDSTAYRWDQLRMDIFQSTISSSGTFFPNQPLRSNFRLSLKAVPLERFGQFFPGLRLKGSPSIEITAKGENERTYIAAEIREANQMIKLAGWIKETDHQPTYDLHLNLHELDLSHWTGDDLYSTSLTGSLQCFGKGLNLQRDTIQLSGIFPEVRYLKKDIRQVIFQSIKSGNQLSGEIRSKAWFGEVKSAFEIKELFSQFNYQLVGNINHMDLSHLELPVTLNSDINLRIKAKGSGWNPLLGKASLLVKTAGSSIFDQPFQEISASIDWNKGAYQLKDLKLLTPYFHLEAKGNGNLWHDNRVQFNFKAKAIDELMRKLKVQPFSVRGNISGTLQGNHKQFEGNAILDQVSLSQGQVSLTGLNGFLAMKKSNQLTANILLKAHQLKLDSALVGHLQGELTVNLQDQMWAKLKLSSDSLVQSNQTIGSMQGTAALRLDDSLRIETNGKAKNILWRSLNAGETVWESKFRLPAKDGKTKLISAIRKLTDSYDILPIKNYLLKLKGQTADLTAQAELINWQMDSLSIKKSNLKVEGQFSENQQKGQLQGQVNQLQFYGLTIQEGELNTHIDNQSYLNQLNLSFSDSLKGQLNLLVDTKDGYSIDLHKSFLKAPLQKWEFGSDSTKLIFRNDQLAIRNLVLFGNKQRLLSVSGNYALKGKEDLTVELANIDLHPINKMAGSPYAIAGIGAATVQLKGTSDKPIVISKLQISDFKVNGERFGNLGANMKIKNDSLQVGVQLDLDKKRLMEGSIEAGYPFSLEKQLILPPASTPINADLKINQVDMGLFQSLLTSGNSTLRGTADGQLTAKGAIDRLDLHGKLSLTEGQLTLPDYGIDYREIQSDLRFSHDSILIQRMEAQAGAGSIKINGYSSLRLDQGLAPKNLHLKVVGKEFKVVDTDALQATVNAAIQIQKVEDSTQFSGNVEVLRSAANADMILSDYYRVKEFSDQPMLVRAIREQGLTSAPDRVPDSASPPKDPALSLSRNLTGSFTIKVPGNTWIKGKDMELEVMGELQAMKANDRLVLYGGLEVKRGFYKMYGKKFDFISGKITLTGEDEINPILDFEIAYPFRDLESKPRSLHLMVTGRLKEPMLNFDIDGKKIDEQDAISYLVFGRSAHEISQGEEAGRNINASGIATNIALNQMSSMLKEVIQSSLKMDVVEITGDNNWSMGSVKVGKYIGKNLYVSYQYNFALDKKSKEIEPMVISVEYQFLKFLSLSATNQSENSGFDILFKKEF